MSGKHTPGPWRLLRDGPPIYAVEDITVIGPHPKGGERMRDVAIAVAAPGTYMQEAAANARLIAEAPDLLAALDELFLRTHNFGVSQSRSNRELMEAAKEKARVVILRARGSQP